RQVSETLAEPLLQQEVGDEELAESENVESIAQEHPEVSNEESNVESETVAEF
ncbi:MAG: hypothetical protein SGILL_009720, partial [Bacillariaceae sp.]